MNKEIKNAMPFVAASQNNTATSKSWETVWSGSRTFTNSGNFSITGLATGSEVQLSATVEFTTDYYDPSGSTPTSDVETLTISNKNLPTTVNMYSAYVRISRSGSQINFEFVPYEEEYKGYVTYVNPTKITFTEVKQYVTSTDNDGALWSGSRTFTSTGSFSIPGLAAGGAVQLSAAIEFATYNYDPSSGTTPTPYIRTVTLNKSNLPTTAYGNSASVRISHTGSQINFEFVPFEQSYKGYVTYETPTKITITEVKQDVNVSMTGIRIKSYPNKTSYKAGEILNPDGLEVVSVYSSGQEKKIVDYKINKSGILTTSDSVVTVTYQEFSATFTITVSSASETKGMTENYVSSVPSPKLTHRLNRAGTGTVDLYDSNLHFTHTDVSYTGNLLPLNILHVYNSKGAQSNSIIVNGSSVYNYSNFGNGWKLNLNQRIMQYTDNNDVVKVVHIDANGEENYYTKTIRENAFNVNGKVFIDDKGSDTIILSNYTGYYLFDSIGNYLFFDINFRLTRIQSFEGSKLTINYGSGINQITSVTDGAGRTANLTYNSSGQLELITEPTGKKTKYEYDSFGNLHKIMYLGSSDIVLYESEFNYEGNSALLTEITDPMGEQIKYSYANRNNVFMVSRVTKATFTDYISDEGVKKDWFNNYDWVDIMGSYNSNGTTFQFNDKVSILTKSGVRYSYHFNKNGHCYLQYESDGSNKSFNAKNIAFYNFSDKYAFETVKIPHRDSSVNLIENGSFEQYTNTSTSNPSGLPLIKPNNWTVDDFTSCDHSTVIDGSRILRLGGKIYQNINLSKVESYSDYLISGWGQIPIIDPLPTDYLVSREISVIIKYTNGTIEEKKIPFENKNLAWQFAGKVIHINNKNSISEIRVCISNFNHANYADPDAYFDDIRFEKIQESMINESKPYIIATTNNYYNGEWQKKKYNFDQITKLSVKIGNVYTAFIDISSSQPSIPEDFLIMQQHENSICCLSKSNSYQVGTEDAKVMFNDGNEYLIKKVEVYFSGDLTSSYQGQSTISIKNEKKDVISSTIIDKNDSSFTNNFTYENHKLKTATDFRNQIIENAFDGLDVVSSIRPSNSQKKIVDESKLTDNKNYTFVEMDERHTPTKEIKSIYTYNLAGDVIKVKAPDGREVNYDYDPYTGELTRIYSTVNNQIIETRFQYIKGYLVKISVNTDTVYTLRYDGFGRLLVVWVNDEILLGNMYIENFHYDTGNVNDFNYMDTTDCGVVYKTYFDKYGRAVKGVKSNNIVSTVDYDNETGQVTQSKDYNISLETGNSNDVLTHKYAYDISTGKANAIISQGNGHTITVKSNVTDNRQDSDEVWIDGERYVTKYNYEKNSNNGIYPDNIVKTLSHRKAGSSTALSTITYNNDSHGRYSSQALKNDSGTQISSQSVTYLDVTDSRYPNGKTTGYISSVTNAAANANKQTNYAYTDAGEIYTVSSNGQIDEKYRYDKLGRLTREDNRLMNRTIVYNYDNSGNITSKKLCGFTLSETDPSGTVVPYGYISGGRPGRLVNYNGKNLTNYSDQPYSSYGQPLVYFNHKSSSSYWNMTWDSRNLKSMQLNNVNGGALQDSLNFRYDGNGIRKSKIYNGTTIDYIYVGNRLMREVRGKTQLTYLYGLDGVVGFELKNEDNVISRYYYQKNIQGDVKNIIDKDGKIVVHYNYDAWGNHKVLNSAGTETTDANFIGNINPIRYRGYYYDCETGLYYLLGRYYDPEVGRFVSPFGVNITDLASLNGSNLYAYCKNSSVMTKQESSGSINSSISIPNIPLFSATQLVPEWVRLSVGALPDIITGMKYLQAKGIHTRFVYSTRTRYNFPILEDSYKWIGKSGSRFKDYGKLTTGSFKQILTGDAKANLGVFAKSVGKTIGLTALINLGFNLIENGFDFTDPDMWIDTAIDTAIGVGAYFLASVSMSLITAGLALAGVSVPGGVVVVGVIVLSIAFDAFIRWLLEYDK